MDKSQVGDTEKIPLAPQERGEILSSIKRWALMGYTQETGYSEGFEQRWREAFYADEAADNDAGRG